MATTLQDLPADELCPVCRDAFVCARMLPCGHVVCASCVLTIHLRSQSAPNRRSTTRPSDPIQSAPISPHISAPQSTTRPSDPIQSVPISPQIYLPDTYASAESTSLLPSLCPICRMRYTLERGDPFTLPQATTTRAALSDSYFSGVDGYAEGAGSHCASEEVNVESTKEQTISNICSFDGCLQDGAFRCFQGCGILCSDCGIAHKRAPFSKYHQTEALDLRANGVLEGVNTCSKHGGAPLEFYCRLCKSTPFLCLRCAYDDSAHRSTHISFQDCLQELDGVLRSSRHKGVSKLSEIDEMIHEAQQFIDQTCDNIELVKSQIKRKCDEFRERVKEVEDALIEKAASLGDELLKPVEMDIEDLWSIRDHVEFGIRLYDEACALQLRQGSMKKYPYAKDVLDSALQRKLPPRPSTTEVVIFCPQDEFRVSISDSKATNTHYDDWVRTRMDDAFIQLDITSLGLMTGKVGGLSNGFGNLQFHYPWGVAVHPKTGNIYIVDKNNHRIQVMSPEQEFLTSFGSQGAGNNQFYYPRGITISQTGSVYVADMNNHRVQIFSDDFVYLGTIGVTGQSGPDDGLLNSPYNIAIDSEGSVYVADLGNKRVQKFSRDGEFLCKFGTPGSGVGELGQAQAIAYLQTGEIAVLSHSGSALKIFNTSGNYLRDISIQKVGGYCNILRGPHDTIFVSDAANHKVMIYNLKGQLLKEFGSKGVSDGCFNGPTGMAIGLDQRLYINDCDNNRVQIFS
eukprot:TRINITY_DN8931_c0_g1_i2.p1 TRINITY_DN8931_c0_g1~~TRINITY_DN8931_c0_g1_i2.p1  ORF type:complete len:740 (-),score=138.11 TRINITY_DN8931_c0_g1_i2:56-2275(-)